MISYVVLRCFAISVISSVFHECSGFLVIQSAW